MGLSGSQYGQIERGGHPNVAFVTLAEILGVLGHELAAQGLSRGRRSCGMPRQIALLGRLRESRVDAR